MGVFLEITSPLSVHYVHPYSPLNCFMLVAVSFAGRSKTPNNSFSRACFLVLSGVRMEIPFECSC